MRHFKILIFAAFSLLMAGIPANSSAGNDSNSNNQHNKIKVAVSIYNGALILDYGIEAEMLLAADFMRRFNVYTVGRDSMVTLSIVVTFSPDYSIADAPAPDVIIIPGGPRWKQEAEEKEIIEFLRKSHEDGAVLYSICTGSLLLAKADLLEKRKATTNHQALQVLKKLSPSTKVIEEKDYVDDGDIITTAGAGTAIDATLHLIERMADSTISMDMSRRYLNYRYQYTQ